MEANASTNRAVMILPLHLGEKPNRVPRILENSRAKIKSNDFPTLSSLEHHERHENTIGKFS